MSNNDYLSIARLPVLHGGLPAFIAVSIVLHGLLLWWQTDRVSPAPADTGPRVMTVVLGDTRSATASSHNPASTAALRAPTRHAPATGSHPAQQAAADAPPASLTLDARETGPAAITADAEPAADNARQTPDTAAPTVLPNIDQTAPAAHPAPDTAMADAPEPNAAPQDQDAAPAALIANLEASRERGQPPAATTVTPPPAQAAATGGTPDARAALLSQIKQQVMTNLDYPLRARRQGWQGQVLLDFRVGETGALDHIQLAQSSGHVLLDRSALRALGLVQRVILPADYPAGLVLQLQLPVIFRLQEG